MRAGVAVGAVIVGSSLAALEPSLETVEPLLAKYCYACHGNDDAAREADLNLQFYADDGLLPKSGEILEELEWLIGEGEMPPERSPQPTDAERAQMLAAIGHALEGLRNASPNDPGLVVMPRLNHREYDYVIRDLTGHDLNAAGLFPRDSGGGEGFTNVGENLVVTPTHAELYLKAAKEVLRHALVLPGRDLEWSDTPFPPTETAAETIPALRQEWVAWHEKAYREATAGVEDQLKKAKTSSLEAYLRAALDVKRTAPGEPPSEEVIRRIAAEQPVPLPPPLLENWVRFLNVTEPRQALTPVLAGFVSRWQAIPPTLGASERDQAIAELLAWRKQTLDDYNGGWEPAHEIEPLPKTEVKMPREEFVRLTRQKKEFLDQLYEQHTYLHRIDLGKLKDPTRVCLVTTDAGDGHEGDFVVWRAGRLIDADGKAVPWKHAGAQAEGSLMDAGGEIRVRAPSAVVVHLPEGFRELHVEAAVDLARSGNWSSVQTVVEPAAPKEVRFIPKRRIYGQIEPPVDRQRDDLADFTRELKPEPFAPSSDFPVELLGQKRGAFQDNTPRLERPNIVHAEALRRYADGEARRKLDDLRTVFGILLGEALAADPQSDLRIHRPLALEPVPEASLTAQAEQTVLDFAQRAWRRPVDPGNAAELLELYHGARREGLSFDASVKRALAAVLVSPRFLYRVQKVPSEEPVTPLEDYEIADRLAFALWASLPDQELLELAAEGALRDPETLRQQARRMVRDSRARALGKEFAAQWLGVSGFQDIASPDPERFPEYNRVLADMMAEETELFFTELFREDRPVLDIIQADYTYLNEPLARFYGIDPGKELKGLRMQKVPVNPERSGGVLAMGSVLTFTSQPMRTSPVKRATWLLTEILGTPPPEPPPVVPPLSDEPVNADGLTVKEQLAQHREDPACAGCHARIDPIGFALENFDPTGRWRETDGAGNPVDPIGETVDGFRIEGFAGLREYLGQQRQRDLFVRQFCRKFLGYVLGRKVELSDDPLLDEMQAALAAKDYRPSAMLDVVVTSPQFLNRRNLPLEAENPTVAKAEKPETL